MQRTGVCRSLCVEIRVKGRVDEQWSDWFGGLNILHTEQNETVLVGAVIDQAAIYGLLAGLGSLNLPLVSVNVSEAGEQAAAQGAAASKGGVGLNACSN
jgi:hypothetical protein